MATNYQSSIPTAPKPPKHTNPPPPSGGGSSGSGSSSGGTSSGGGSGSGGSGGSSDPYAYARHQQARAENRARQEHLRQVRTLQQQVDSLRSVLNGGFRKALDIRLANIGLVQRQTDQSLRSEYTDRVGALAGAADDNAQAADSQTVANANNRSRERMNALSEAFANGAGESDVMRAQEASLRNWNANQADVNRSYFDTLRSVNSSLTDLTADTRTARINNVMQSNADREQQWTSFFNQRSEAYTQLGNTLGMQAEEFSLAHAGAVSGDGSGKRHHHKGKDGGMGGGGKPLVGGGPVTSPGINPGTHLGGRHGAAAGLGSYDSKNAEARDAFMAAAHEQSRAWRNPGVGKNLMNWDGHADFGSTVHNNQLSSMATTDPMVRPEGATLRKWA